MFTLRPYQTESVAAGVNFLTTPSDENGLLVLPTGSGKSLVIAKTVLSLDGPALVFQPSKEILEQNAAKMLAYGFRPAIYSASVGKKRVGQITLATIGSVVRKPELFRHVKYVLVDECHGIGAKNADSMFMQFLSALKGVRVLGYTATPYRLNTDRFGGSMLKFLTRTRPRVFHRVVHVVQNGDLFAQGHLARLEYKEVATGFRTDRLRLNSTGADYTDESVRNHFRELHFSDKIVRCVNRLGELNRRGTLVFTRFVEEAEYVASKIPCAAVVTAETSKYDRESILRRFIDGRISTVCNVGVLVVGFDFPQLANVILAQPMRSLARYYQMTGRVMRPHPSKDCGYVIDMVGMVAKFGKIEDLHIACGPHETWYVESNGRKLTNIYFDAPRPLHFQP